MEAPKILWNAKDHPDVPSGYGIITRHLVPRLVKHYGEGSVLIYAPVFSRNRREVWRGIPILPGLKFDYGEEFLLDHYTNYHCNMLLQVGDWFGMQKTQEYAMKDKVFWVQWAPWDWLNFPDWVRSVANGIHRVVPFTKYAEERFKKEGVKNTLDAIWLGLDTEIWRPGPKLPGIMSSLGFREDTYNIVIVAANQQRKCLPEVLEGISIVRNLHPEYNIRVYLHTNLSGDVDLTAFIHQYGLEEVCQSPNQYEYVTGGFSEEQMAKVFNSADVVMDCCLEGFGFSMTQAQSMGVPVIYLNEGPGDELVRYGVRIPYYSVDRRDVLFKPVPNPGHIAEALEGVYSVKGKRNQSAISHIQENFSWDRIAEQWIGVIDNLMVERDKFSMFVPEPSEFLINRSREIVEVKE